MMVISTQLPLIHCNKGCRQVPTHVDLPNNIASNLGMSCHQNAPYHHCNGAGQAHPRGRAQEQFIYGYVMIEASCVGQRSRALFDLK